MVATRGNARAREPRTIGSQLIPSHRSRCQSQHVKIKLMMEIVKLVEIAELVRIKLMMEIVT